MNSNLLVALIVIAIVIGVLALLYLTQPAPSKPEEPVPSPEEVVNYTPQLPEEIAVNETELPEENETLPDVNESLLEIPLPEEI